MRIDKYKYAKELAKYQEQLIQSKINTPIYLQQSLELYDLPLLEHFGKSLYYHRLVSLAESRKDGVILTTVINRKQVQGSEICVNLAAQLVNEGYATAISDLILSKMKNGVVLYKGNLPQQDYLIDFTTLNLGNLSDNGHSLFDEAYKLEDSNGGLANFQQTFEIEDVQKMQSMLGCYWKYSQNYTEQYIYFLRPLVKHDTFNGVWLLIFDRPLEDEEYLELITILLKILSETAIAKIEQYAKEGERALMIDELAHSNKHEIAALEDTLRYLKRYFYRENKQRFIEEWDFGVGRTEMMRNINDFFLCLLRAGANGENYANLEGGFKHTLQREYVSIKEVLLEALKKMEYSIKSLGFQYTDHREKVKGEVISKLKAQIATDIPLIQVWVIRTGFEIILLDIIKNMLKHTHHQNPKSAIFIEKTGDSINLHFQNNLPFENISMDYWLENENAEVAFEKYRTGLRTIKRITSFPYFTTDNVRWGRGITKHKDNNITDLFFSIPNNCIKYE